MDTHSDDEDIPAPFPEEPIYTSFGGGMFAGSQYFTIGGGMFNNTTNHYHVPPAEAPSSFHHFRMIPMGDIDLQRELMVNAESGNIGRRRKQGRARRVYSAKIDGRNADRTVALYEGDGAEEAWLRDVEIYMSLRHPNIVQMYGTARSGAMYVTIFHGDLIPLPQFVASASPIMTVYIYACYVTEWKQARDYVSESPYFCDYVAKSPYPRKSSQVDWEIHSTLSIRRSNGQLCADFLPQPDGKDFFYSLYSRKPHPPVNLSLDPSSPEAAVIDSLMFEEYYYICGFTLLRHRSASVSSSTTISFGAVFLCPPNGQPRECAEIVAPSGAEFFGWGWPLGEERLSRPGMLMENDWTRFNTKDACNNELTYTVVFDDYSAWLAQANHIFSRLQITSSFEDYLVVRLVEFEIAIGNTREDAPLGYLFLCPTTDFQTEPASFRWPDCPAYWSLTPSGADRLSTEEATQLGLPSFQLTTVIRGSSWDTSVYAGLRQFHQAKGFDSGSQDIALHLRLPLFRLSGDMKPSFAHVGELSENNPFDDDMDEAAANGSPLGHNDVHQEDRFSITINPSLLYRAGNLAT